MKKLFWCLIFFMITLNFGYVLADETESEPELITKNFIEVSNKKVIEQNDKKALISFEIKNKQDFYYPTLYYIVSLSKMEEVAKDVWSSRTILDYAPVEFDIGPNQSKTISYSCEFPKKLTAGEYCLDISFYEKNHEISLAPETIILSSMGTQKEFLIETEEPYLTVDGVREGALTGPNINESSDIKANFSVKSLFNEAHLFTPKITIYKRNTIYNIFPMSETFGSSVEIKPGEVKNFELPLPIISTPESYLVKIILLDENLVQVSNQYSFRYVTSGISANVKAFEINFNEENDLIADLWVMGPADGSKLNNCTVEFQVKTEDEIVIDSKKEVMDLGDISKKISIVIENSKISNFDKIFVNAKVLYNDRKIVEEERITKIENITSETKGLRDIVGTRYEEAVTLLNGLGILNGYPDGTFKPENTITRAEFASIMVKINELKINEEETSKFWDVGPEHWAKNYINACAESGLVSGYTDGSFMPGNNVNYAEALTILINALGYKEDVALREVNWPYNYTSKSTELGLHNNVGNIDFFVAATRGDIAILTMNAYLLK